MKIPRIALLGVAVALLSGALAPAAHAAGDVEVTGNKVIRSGTVIKGDLTVRRGTVTVNEGAVITGDLIVREGTAKVFGAVRGNVRQSGAGGVAVGETGRVHGGVIEVGSGDVSISGKVLGATGVVERDRGDVTIRGQVEKVDERGQGTVRVRDGLYSAVRGSIREFDDGDVIVFLKARSGDTIIRGTAASIKENGNGSIIVVGEVLGNVRETGPGLVSVRDTAVIGGNVVESEAGDVYVDSGSQIGGRVLETGEGELIVR